MVKKIYAVTNIKGSDVEVTAGEEIDKAQFSSDELKGLYDAGAIEVREGGEEKIEVVKGPDTSVANKMFSAPKPEEPKKVA